MDLPSFLIGLLCGVTEAILMLTSMQISFSSRSVKSLWNRHLSRCGSADYNPDYTPPPDSNSDSVAESRRKFEADLKAFSDTMNYSIEQAYGIGET